MTQVLRSICILTSALSLLPNSLFAEESVEKVPVSYSSQIRLIFQAHCQGCHQPAKKGGDYDMTTFDKLFKSGESGLNAITAGNVKESYLLDLITPDNKGVAEMPKGKPALTDAEIELIRRWVSEGAKDDSPPSAQVHYDQDNPPVYVAPPVVTSLDYSPDGSLIAVAGFHEVLLHNADGSGLVARLVGLSERVESVKFSPDGKTLAVVGGLPARMGEIQFWDVATKKLRLSVPMTHDTLFGASYSPDGKLLAFGCADNTVRAIDTSTGKQVLFQGAHNDWVLDTVINTQGTSVVSVSRDFTMKLTDIRTERFIGNITTHTPGVLKGGLNTVALNRTNNQLITAGADGQPKLFRMEAKAAPASGGNPNQIREYAKMPGRVFGVAFAPDGQKFAAVSSLNNAGHVQVYQTGDGKTVWEKSMAPGYAVVFSPDGRTVAVSGTGGEVATFDVDSGKEIARFAAAPVTPDAQRSVITGIKPKSKSVTTGKPETLPKGTKLTGLRVEPSNVKLRQPFETAQLLVFGELDTGDVVDVTRIVQFEFPQQTVSLSSSGLMRPVTDGQFNLGVSLHGQTANIPVEVTGIGDDFSPAFITDVGPVISKLGCNAGTCHGAKDGKNGFKLSLRGYDPIFDSRAFTDDLASRRVNPASPDDSLMLLKMAANVPHTGSLLASPGEPHYEVIRKWIADGAVLDLEAPRVSSIEIHPANPIVQIPGARQQVRVIATYPDGSTRDVTAEAFTSTGNTEIATANETGLIHTLRRGETPVLSRYEGAYASTTLTVMGDRSGFTWQEPPVNNEIDVLVVAKWERTRTLPSGLCTDAEFIRRVYLDLTGLPPTSKEVKAFLADERETKVKRDELIDKLIGSDDYIEYWTNKWADLLQVNRKFLDTSGAAAFRKWIRNEIATNTPYDEFAHKILTAEGSNLENPAASYFKITRTPEDTMENTTHLFLGVRFSCNKCHDHPFERWTQDQYYETAAYFAQFGLKKDPKSGKKEIGKTAIEKGKPLYEIVYDMDKGEVKHDRTGQVTPPRFPFATNFDEPEKKTRRQMLAAWMTSPDNAYFARSYANRIWGYLLGTGIIEPIDDIRAGNPPTNPDLLNHLTSEFIDSGFNTRELVRMICKSRTYQLSIETNKWNEDDTINYSHAIARRLPAEVLYDAVHRVTGSVSRLPGVPAGTRAAELPDSGVKLPDGFLGKLGRPARESACECERTSSMQLGPIMAFVSGPTVGNALSDENNAIAKLVASQEDDAALVNELFLRILNRPATRKEITTVIKVRESLREEHNALVREMKEYEQIGAEERERKAKMREAAIAAVQKQLDAYRARIAPREAKLNKKQRERTAKLLADLQAYQNDLVTHQMNWEKTFEQQQNWKVIDPVDLAATNAAKLTREDDLSVFASGKNGKGDYKIIAETDLKNITGIRLELLADDRLPKKGPGRSPSNGNFVLSEFELQIAPTSDTSKVTKVKLQNAKADFSQGGYDVKTAIDGKIAASANGWASAPQLGVNRTAVFETSKDIGFESGTQLTFILKQQYQDGQHSIGRFRLSVTTRPRPVQLDSAPQEIAAIVATPVDQRNDQQKKKLTDYFRKVDPVLSQKTKAVADSKKPRPIDPQLKTLQEAHAYASRPLPKDDKLERYRTDVRLSEQQLQKSRLTIAQDLAWVLVNSPAFLFNH